MSLFIGGLAFSDAARFDAVRLGVLAGSALAGVAGAAVLATARTASPAPHTRATPRRRADATPKGFVPITYLFDDHGSHR